MPGDNTIIANVTNVVDTSDGKRVTVEVRVLNSDVLDTVRDNRARARALVGAGFAKEGFIRNLDFELQLPRLERRTEIISKDKIGDDLWSYTIKVRSGVIFG